MPSHEPKRAPQKLVSVKDRWGCGLWRERRTKTGVSEEKSLARDWLCGSSVVKEIVHGRVNLAGPGNSTTFL